MRWKHREQRGGRRARRRGRRSWFEVGAVELLAGSVRDHHRFHGGDGTDQSEKSVSGACIFFGLDRGPN
jgi:hypothetical protein